MRSITRNTLWIMVTLALLGGLLFLLATSLNTAQQTTASPSAVTATTAIWPPVAQPSENPATLAPTIAARFERSSQRHKLDFSCMPPCWNDFKPGQTSIEAVLQWLDEVVVSEGQVMADYKNDRTAPNNTVALVGSSSPTIVAYGDGSSPAPRLRAYRIGLRRDLPVPNAALNPEILRWLLSSLLSRAEIPSTIHIATMAGPAYTKQSEQPRYYLLLDYGGWAVEIVGFIGSQSLSSRIPVCDEDQVSIAIWVYAPAEGNALAVLRAISGYETYDQTRVMLPEATQLKPLSPSEVQSLAQQARARPACLEIVLPK